MFILTGCPDKNVNPDPCAGSTQVKADFTMYEQLPYDSLFVADTVLQYNVVYFIAKGNYKQYKWKIGNDDSTFTGDTIRLHFDQPFSQIAVTLFVSSEPNTKCFPNDDGKDTITKYLCVVPWRGGSALIGYYKGITLDNPKDTFIVNVGFHDVFIDGHYNRSFYYVDNINRDCHEPRLDSTFSKNRYLIGYKCIHIEGTGTDSCGCNYPLGYGTLDQNNGMLTFEYTTGGIKPRQNHIFKGKKL